MLGDVLGVGHMVGYIGHGVRGDGALGDIFDTGKGMVWPQGVILDTGKHIITISY